MSTIPLLNPLPSIETFDRIMSYLAYVKEERPQHYAPEFTLRPKIKLHGMNSGFGVSPEHVWAQGRTEILSKKNPLAGAFPVLTSLAEKFAQTQKELRESGWTATVMGEWAGQGVQRKDAITQIGKKMFFPFGITLQGPDFVSSPDDRRSERRQMKIITDPAAIQKFLGFTDERMMIIPWAGPAVTFNAEDTTSLEAALDQINALSEEIGVCDPFVRDTFGVEGPGEGLVYVLDSGEGTINYQTYADYIFKAKAERHRVKISEKAAKIHAEIPEDVHAFVDAFVTENRMEQMLHDKLGGDTDKKRTGDFVAAVIADVLKESVPERAAMNVTDKAIGGLVAKKASKWFLAQATVAYDADPR